jgi:hypothetical protein
MQEKKANFNIMQRVHFIHCVILEKKLIALIVIQMKQYGTQRERDEGCMNYVKL